MITVIVVAFVGGGLVALGVVGDNPDVAVGGGIVIGFSLLAGLAWAWRIKR